MHAVVLTFDRDIPDEAYSLLCHEFADGFAAIAGLVAKAFVGRGHRSGGIYFFTDAATADSYLDGPIVAGLSAQTTITALTVERFDVDDDVSARTGLGALVGEGVQR